LYPKEVYTGKREKEQLKYVHKRKISCITGSLMARKKAMKRNKLYDTFSRNCMITDEYREFLCSTPTKV